MMERNHGHLVYVSSIAGLIGSYQLTDYCASKFASVGLEESLRLELNCDGYDGIYSTVICPYYIKTGLFAGIRRSLIPIMTPEYVVNEAMNAIRVNQEILCVPWMIYFMLLYKWLVPAKTFMWSHRAIGAAATMKTFQGRNGPPPAPQPVHTANHNQQQVVMNMALAGEKSPLTGEEAKPVESKPIAQMTSPTPEIEITIPEVEEHREEEELESTQTNNLSPRESVVVLEQVAVSGPEVA